MDSVKGPERAGLFNNAWFFLSSALFFSHPRPISTAYQDRPRISPVIGTRETPPLFTYLFICDPKG